VIFRHRVGHPAIQCWLRTINRCVSQPNRLQMRLKIRLQHLNRCETHSSLKGSVVNFKALRSSQTMEIAWEMRCPCRTKNFVKSRGNNIEFDLAHSKELFLGTPIPQSEARSRPAASNVRTHAHTGKRIASHVRKRARSGLNRLIGTYKNRIKSAYRKLCQSGYTNNNIRSVNIHPGNQSLPRARSGDAADHYRCRSRLRSEQQHQRLIVNVLLSLRYDNSDGQVELVPNKPIVILKNGFSCTKGGFHRFL